MKRVLLHVCCGPCSIGSIPKIEDWDITLFYANSNINSEEEFKKRYIAAEKVAHFYNRDIIDHPYNHPEWLEHIKGLENEPEKGDRCLKCFEYSFTKTAEEAVKKGFNFFTSTLTISPHKNSKQIIEIGKDVAKLYGLEYLEVDFSKENGYKRSIDLSKELGLYRQKYCGCEFSIWW